MRKKKCKRCKKPLTKWDITNRRKQCAACDNATFVGSHLAGAISGLDLFLPDLEMPFDDLDEDFDTWAFWTL